MRWSRLDDDPDQVTIQLWWWSRLNDPDQVIQGRWSRLDDDLDQVTIQQWWASSHDDADLMIKKKKMTWRLEDEEDLKKNMTWRLKDEEDLKAKKN